jgi:Bardet-Biedl syndrome 2 protein
MRACCFVQLVRAEDSRLLNNAADMKGHYRALRDLNRNLVVEHEKRVTKHGEVSKQLKLTNSIIQAAARLRLGRCKEQLVSRCRKAVQEQDVEAFVQSIREGG